MDSFIRCCLPLAPRQKGLTLFELLISLSIATILTGIAIPSFQVFIGKASSEATQEQLRTAIYRTRQAALSYKKIVTLCPLGEHSCADDWSTGVMIFTDENNDRAVDDDDIILERLYFDQRKIEIFWRASAGRNYLRYSPTGVAREFGRFIICHKSNDLSLARGILINRQGRLRVFRDRDADGVVEDIDGSLPECSNNP